MNISIIDNIAYVEKIVLVQSGRPRTSKTETKVIVVLCSGSKNNCARILRFTINSNYKFSPTFSVRNVIYYVGKTRVSGIRMVKNSILNYTELENGVYQSYR